MIIKNTTKRTNTTGGAKSSSDTTPTSQQDSIPNSHQYSYNWPVSYQQNMLDTDPTQTCIAEVTSGKISCR